MSNFIIDNNTFIADLSLNSQRKWLELSTAGTFVDKNISIQITATTGNAATPATTIAQAPTITLTTATGAIVASYTQSQSVTPTITAGWVGSGTAGTITTTGSYSITLPASTATATDDTITIGPGWFGSTTSISIAAGSARTPATSITQNPTFELTTATGAITASYEKSQSITPSVTPGYVSEGTSGIVYVSGNSSMTLPTATVALSANEFSVTPGWIGATTAITITTVSVTASNASKSSTNFTQAVLSVPTGYVNATTVTGASFANSASSGTTYLDISNTTGAPILASEGYLYINKGYTDNVRISLAKLIPDDANVSASDQLRSGYAAYDSAGNLITGNIPDKSSSDVTESASNVIVPSGYYASTVTLALDAGDYSAGVTLSSVTVTPSVTISSASTYGFTTTEPSSGTYITINPDASSPTYTATGAANITTAGYISTGSKYQSATASVGVAAGTNYYARAVTPTIGGNGLTTTTNVGSLVTTPVVAVGATGTFVTASDYGVTTIQPISGVDGTSYLSINATGAISTTGSVVAYSTVRRNTATYSNAAGVITTHTNSKLQNATTISQTATVAVTPDIDSSFNTLYMPIVTPSFNGGGLTTNTHTNVVTTAPNVTLSATGTLVSATDYGVTTVQPTSGTYRTIDVYAVANNGQAKSDFKVTRATSNFSVLAGAIAQYDNVKTLNGASNTGTQSVAVTPTVTDNFDTLYIPVITNKLRIQIQHKALINNNFTKLSTTPVVTISTTGTLFSQSTNYGVTTIQPTGSDGIDFLTFDNQANITDGNFDVSVSAGLDNSTSIHFTENNQGLISLTTATNMSSSNTTGYATASYPITPSITDNFATHYMPIVSTTFSGGALTVSSTNAISTNMATTATSSYYIDAVATITATRAQVNYNNAAGAIAAHSGATAINASNSNSSSTATRIYIPKATFSMTHNGGSLSTTAILANIQWEYNDTFNNQLSITNTSIVTMYRDSSHCVTAGYITTGTQVTSLQTSGDSDSQQRYLKGVTLNKPASGEAKFSITVPNGLDDMITFVFHVDPSGNVVVDDSTSDAFS